MTKKRIPTRQDLTIRNLRAMKTRVADIEKRLRGVEFAVYALQETRRAPKRKTKRV